MTNQKRNRKLSRNRQGAMVVEMAMCLPILFLLLFGCYEFARADMIRHNTEAAAYEGARTGIVPGATADDVRESVRFVLSTTGVGKFDVDINPATIQTRDPNITVTVTVRMRENTTLGLLFNENAQFIGRCQLSREAL